MHTSYKRKDTPFPKHLLAIDQALVSWIQNNFSMLMPEEVVLALQLNNNAFLIEKAIGYVNQQLSQMELQEVTTVYTAIMASNSSIKESSP